MYDKPTTHTYLTGRNCVLLRVRNKTGMSTFTASVHHGTGVPATAVTQEKEVLGSQPQLSDRKKK